MSTETKIYTGSTIHYTCRVVDMDEPLTIIDAGLGPIGYTYITYSPENKESDSTICHGSPDCTIVSDKTFKKGPYFDNSYPVEK